jgi:hypothetical protein
MNQEIRPDDRASLVERGTSHHAENGFRVPRVKPRGHRPGRDFPAPVVQHHGEEVDPSPGEW